jgi:hypothetical protein
VVRRGSIGDDSDNDFGDGGSDTETDAGSGVTGDDGSETSYGGGSTDESTAGSDTVSGPSAGDDDSGDTGDGGDTDLGGSDDDGGDTDLGGGDDDSDYDPNPSSREVGGTDDRDLDTVTNGGTDERAQSTGDDPSRNEGGAGGDEPTEASREFRQTLGDDVTADRGLSTTTVAGADAPSQLERSEALRDELGQDEPRAERREEIAARVAREYDVDRENVRVGQSTDGEFEAVVVEDEQAFEAQTAVTGAPDPGDLRPAVGRFEQTREGGDSRLQAAADDGPPPVEGGDVRLANRADERPGAQDTAAAEQPVSGGDARLRTAADARAVDLRATRRTADEPLNYGRRARYAAGLDVLAGSTDEAVGRAVDAARRGDVAGVGDALAGSTDEAVGRAVAAARAGDPVRAADNLAGGVDDAAIAATDDVRTLAPEVDTPDVPGDGRDSILPGIYGDAAAAGAAVGREARTVDVPVDEDRLAGVYADAFVEGATGGEQTGAMPNIYAGISATGVAIGDDVNDEIEAAEINRATTDRLTRGGYLSERDEQRLREAAAQFNQDVRSGVNRAAAVSPLTLADEAVRGGIETAGVDTDLEGTVDTAYGEAQFDTERLGEGNIERAQEAAAESLLTATNPFALAQAGETGTEVAANLDEEVETGDAATAAVGASALAIGRETGEAIVTRARRDPSRFGGSLAGELVLGAGAGRAAGIAARRGVDRARTVGGTRVDLDELTNPDTAAYYNDPDADVGEEARFPGAEDPDLYETDPAEAVRQQADEYTPAPIREDFEAAGVEEGTDLKKGLETEPEGQADPPRLGRGSGFITEAGGYESPGGFAAPELSPNFLGVGRRSFSARPGLPSLGGRPTSVIARTDVENPDADTLDEFNRELIEDRIEDTTAVTKPAETAGEAGGLRTGEIEAVIPPGARFRAIDSATSGANRFGIGASYYTEVRGRRVPLRLVAPEDSIDTDSATVDADAQPLGYYARAPGESVDRPAPTADATTAGGDGSETATDDADAPEDDLLGARERDSGDDLLGVRDARESVDATATEATDDLDGVRPRDRDTTSDRGADTQDDDLLGVRPRDSDAESSRRATSDDSENLLGVRSRERRDSRRDRSSRGASGATGSSAASRGRSERITRGLAPSITPGPPGRGESTVGSWFSTPEIIGRSTVTTRGGQSIDLTGGSSTEGPPDPPPEPPTEPPPEPPDDLEWEWDGDIERTTDRFPERTAEDDRPLSVGYYNEFVADFAFGPAPARAPSQERLASFEGAEQYTEQLPTLRELEAEGEERAALAAAYDTFGASALTVTSDDDGGGGLL